jgi:hypothetical protein
MAKKKKPAASGGLTATTPPLGSYDPSYEANRASARRGLSDLVYDTQTGEVRAREDYTTQLADYLRQFTRGGEDISTREGDVTRTQQRGLADIGLARSRAGEDFAYQRKGLNRRYAALGEAQGEAINKTGQLRGGALAAAAQKRAGNKAFEFQPIQVNYNRTVQDLGTQQSRLNEDTGLSLSALARSRTRLGEDYSTNTNLAGRTFTRGQEDRATNLSRATREQQIGEADITAQEYFDASQRNPTMTFPSSAYTGGGGTLSSQTQKKKKKR